MLESNVRKYTSLLTPALHTQYPTKPSNIEDILDNSNTARGNTTAEQTPMVNVIIGILQRHHENDVPTPLEFSGQRIFETTTSGRQFQNATAHCT